MTRAINVTPIDLRKVTRGNGKVDIAAVSARLIRRMRPLAVGRVYHERITLADREAAQ